jgi:hypothetical protein
MTDIAKPNLCDLSLLNYLPERAVGPVQVQSEVLVWDQEPFAATVRGVKVKINFFDKEGVHQKELWNRLIQVLQGLDRKILLGVSQKKSLTLEVGPRSRFQKEYPKYSSEDKSVTGAYFPHSNKIFVFTDRLLNSQAQGGKSKAERVYLVFQHALLHELGHAVYFQMLKGAHTFFAQALRRFPFPPLFVIHEKGISFAFPDKNGAPNASELFAESFREVYARRLSRRSIDYSEAVRKNSKNPCLAAALESLQNTERFMSVP